jgi:hypothetical protein
MAKPAGKDPRGPYRLHGDIPWPELGDGTPYVLDGHTVWSVTLPDHPEETGFIQWVEWSDLDGMYVPGLSVNKRGQAKPGQWMAVVNWDSRAHHEAVKARHPLAHLVPIRVAP